MSVVVWDGVTLAADRQATTAGMRVLESKIRRLDDGTLVAWTGTHEQGLALLAWYLEGACRDAWPAWQKNEDWTRLVVVSPAGELRFVEQLPFWQELKDPCCAFGSGRDYAMGALAMGADARRAVKVASQFDVHSGNGVEAFDVAEPGPGRARPGECDRLLVLATKHCPNTHHDFDEIRRIAGDF